MKVRVKVFGYLRRYCNQESSREFAVPLPENATAKDLLESLSIPENEEMILLINNAYSQKERALQENDEVLVYPFIGGG